MESKLKDGRNVLIREVEVTDATLLLEYFERVNLESKNLLREPGEYVFTVSDERKFIRRVLQSSDEYMAVAFCDDELIGSIGFRSSHLKRITHRGSIGMSVRKDFNGLGLGSLMMEYIMNIAKEMGKTKLELEVRIDNLSAVHLYEKYGFELEGTIKSGFFVDEKYVDLLMMGKFL
jgi:RimJ/RimL family protein N-acetyltransferase